MRQPQTGNLQQGQKKTDEQTIERGLKTEKISHSKIPQQASNLRAYNALPFIHVFAGFTLYFAA